jgi:hypothetical protein
MLVGHLGARFASAGVKRMMPFFCFRAIKVQVAQGSEFWVMLKRSQYENENDQWILFIGPVRNLYPELRQVCREIHAMLTSTPGITDVFWYFEGSRSQSEAVVTPDELPWGHSSGSSPA